MTSRLSRRVLIIAAIAVVVVAGVVGASVYYKEQTTVDRAPAELCRRLEPVRTLDRAFVTLDPTTLGPLVSDLQNAVDAAPNDIRADIETLAKFVDDVAAKVRATPTDKQKAFAQALAERQSDIDSITVAGRNLEFWTTQNCSFVLRSVTN